MSAAARTPIAPSHVATAAIIGISHYGRQHLMLLLEQVLQGRLRLVAAVVVNQEEEEVFCRRLQLMGCEIFSSADEMWLRFEGKVDLCFIPTGIHLHAVMTLQALKAGSAVMVEKPVAASLAQARDVMKAEQETGKFVAVGFQDLFTESTWKIKERILNREIGELKSASFVGLWPRGAAYYGRNNWAGRISRDGHLVVDSPVSNAFSHFLNLALFWSGSDVETSARVKLLECELYRGRDIESFDTCCARAGLAGGCEIRFYLSHCCPQEREARLVMEGTKGEIAWVQESHYEITKHDGSVERHPVPGKIETKFLMGDALSARLAGNPARVCSTAIALEHLRLVEAMHAASEIVSISTDDLQRNDSQADEKVVIPGIEELCLQASREKKLWSEMGVPWARRGQVYDLVRREHVHRGSGR